MFFKAVPKMVEKHYAKMRGQKFGKKKNIVAL